VGDLFFDDITDEKAYPSTAILKDLRALIANGQREGQMIDYKVDISPKDNWPETVAAFANSVGGIIVFGIEGKGDQPRNLSGFDPKGVEVKTQLTSMVISRIQPRPKFQIRVLALDTDPTKEVAILRISEGEHTPYMHSKEDQRRVYLRSGAQKVEADYLQLRSLFEKGERATAAAVPISAIENNLQARGPRVPGALSDHFIRFIIAPFGTNAVRRLTAEVENLFLTSVERAFPADFSALPRTERKQNLTIIRDSAATDAKLQDFAIDNLGAMGMMKIACLRTDKGELMFSPKEFVADLIDFLFAVSHYYDKIQFYGDCKLTATILIPEALETKADKFRGRWLPGSLFEPPIPKVQANLSSAVRMSLHPRFVQRIPSYAEEVMTDFARACGSLVSQSFQKFAEDCVADTLAKFQ